MDKKLISNILSEGLKLNKLNRKYVDKVTGIVKRGTESWFDVAIDDVILVSYNDKITMGKVVQIYYDQSLLPYASANVPRFVLKAADGSFFTVDEFAIKDGPGDREFSDAMIAEGLNLPKKKFEYPVAKVGEPLMDYIDFQNELLKWYRSEIPHSGTPRAYVISSIYDRYEKDWKKINGIEINEGLNLQKKDTSDTNHLRKVGDHVIWKRIINLLYYGQIERIIKNKCYVRYDTKDGTDLTNKDGDWYDCNDLEFLYRPNPKLDEGLNLPKKAVDPDWIHGIVRGDFLVYTSKMERPLSYLKVGKKYKVVSTSPWSVQLQFKDKFGGIYGHNIFNDDLIKHFKLVPLRLQEGLNINKKFSRVGEEGEKLQYDNLGRCISKINPNGFWEKWGYDKHGNVNHYENSDGYWENMVYDKIGSGKYTRKYYENSLGQKRGKDGRLIEEKIIIPEKILNEAYIDANGNLADFSFDMDDDKPKLYYPYKQLEPYIKDFRDKHSQEMNDYGFDIFVSDSQIPNEKYNLGIDQDYYQIQKLDQSDTGLSDQDVIESAKRMGILVDEYGVVMGFTGKDFVERYNKKTW